MSINVEDNLNDAIVEKVQSILDNTNLIDSIHITIKGNRGEAPTIRYDIREFITPKEAKNEQRSFENIYQEGYYDGHLDGYTKAINEEKQQGEWINREAFSNTIFPFGERYECSICHKYNGYSNFCPNCGAKMKKGGAEE